MIEDFFFCFIYNVALEHKVVINKETEINDLFAIILAGRKSLMRIHFFPHRLSTKSLSLPFFGLWDIQYFDSLIKQPGTEDGYCITALCGLKATYRLNRKCPNTDPWVAPFSDTWRDAQQRYSFQIGCKPGEYRANRSFPPSSSWLSMEIILAACTIGSMLFLSSVLLSLSFWTFFGITLFMSGLTPPLFECLTCLSFTSVSLHHSLLCNIFGICFVLRCPHSTPPFFSHCVCLSLSPKSFIPVIFLTCHILLHSI